MSVHVLGAGSLGTLFAAHLRGAGRLKTTLLLRKPPPTGQVLLCVTRGTGHSSLRSEHIVDAEHSNGDGPPISTLVVATKAFDARGAIESVVPRLRRGSAIIIMCNGALAIAEQLRVPNDSAVLFATTTHGAYRPDSNGAPVSTGAPTLHVHHASATPPGEQCDGQRPGTWLGSLPRPSGDAFAVPAAAAARRASHIFGAAGLGASLETSEETMRRLWLKLAANAVINPLTSLWDVPNGEVLGRPEGADLAREVCDEIGALASRLQPGGVASPGADELLEFATSCARATASNFSSMLMDVRAGRPTEIEELNGWVAAKASELGLAHEANARLAESVRRLTQS